MPRLWIGYGNTPTGDSKPVSISFADFNIAFGNQRVRRLPGDPVGFTPDVPAAAHARVFLQVGEDELKPPLFLRAGHYLLEGVSPDSARDCLRKVGIEPD
jgi:hypothetical protein